MGSWASFSYVSCPGILPVSRQRMPSPYQITITKDSLHSWHGEWNVLPLLKLWPWKEVSNFHESNSWLQHLPPPRNVLISTFKPSGPPWWSVHCDHHQQIQKIGEFQEQRDLKGISIHNPSSLYLTYWWLLVIYVIYILLRRFLFTHMRN